MSSGITSHSQVGAKGNSMANNSNYTAGSLIKKFQERSLYEKWHYTWNVIRGLLRRFQVDSPHLILMGRSVKIDKRNGQLTSGGVCVIQAGCRIAIVGKPEQPAHLHIGEGTEIGDRTTINVNQEVNIGACCSISWDCDISDTDFHQVILKEGKTPPVTAPVIIEDNVWIGSHCLIFKGVTIGHHSVVAAGSVVHRSVPPYSLVTGNPARRIDTIEGWQR